MSSEDRSRIEDYVPGFGVGPLGKSAEFAESLYAGFIYSAAIQGLMQTQLEVNEALEMADKFPPDVLAEIHATDKEMEEKWLLAMGMLGIEA
jgi:hypothetical protein